MDMSGFRVRVCIRVINKNNFFAAEYRHSQCLEMTVAVVSQSSWGWLGLVGSVD